MTSFETLVLIEAAKSLAGIVTKSAWETGGGWLSRMKFNENIQQAVFNASKKYVESYANRHGILKILGMREPVKLENIYTEVQFLREDDIQRYASIESLEKDYRQSSKRRFLSEKYSKYDSLEVAIAILNEL